MTEVSVQGDVIKVVELGTQGPPGAPSATVATTAAISLLSTASMASGMFAYVSPGHPRSWWRLDKTNTRTPVANVILATDTGVGCWERMSWTDPAYAAQVTWYIDPLNLASGGPSVASDSNDGLLATTPLATVAELVRRVCNPRWRVSARVDLYIDSTTSTALARGELVTGLKIDTSPAGTLWVHGRTVTTIAGVLAAGTAARVPATNTGTAVNFVGLGAYATANPFALLTVTSGANAGQSAFLAAVVAGDTVRCSSPSNWNASLLRAAGVMVATDPVSVQNIPILDISDVDILTGVPSLALLPLGAVVFENIFIRGGLTFSQYPGTISGAGRAALFSRNCVFQNMIFSGVNETAINSRREAVGYANAFSFPSGGIMTGIGVSFGSISGGTTHDDPLIQSSQCAVQGGSVLYSGGMCAFDSASPFYIATGSRMVMSSHSLWGSGNTVSKIDFVGGGACTFALGANFYITGTGADYRFEGRSSGTLIDPATGAQTANQTTTFAALALSGTPQSMKDFSSDSGMLYSPQS